MTLSEFNMLVESKRWLLWWTNSGRPPGVGGIAIPAIGTKRSTWDGICLTCGGPTDGAETEYYSHKNQADCIRYLGGAVRYMTHVVRDLSWRIEGAQQPRSARELQDALQKAAVTRHQL